MSLLSYTCHILISFYAFTRKKRLLSMWYRLWGIFIVLENEAKDLSNLFLVV